MRLLILLSALLAGLTGMIAGPPAYAHRGEQTAVASAPAAPAEQVAEIDRIGALPAAENAAPPSALAVWRIRPTIEPRGERRLE